MKYYSQFGEDKFLNEKEKLPKKGIFVDVGAGGTENSNSLFFEEKGWKCLCIEPDKRHEGLEKRKLVDHSIVGSSNKMVDFTFHRLPQLNGIFHGNKSSEKMQMVTLDSILEKYSINDIDILSNDVEGNEIGVLKGTNLEKYKPTYIIVEYTNQFKGNCYKYTVEILKEFGYEEIYRTQSNLIFKN